MNTFYNNLLNSNSTNGNVKLKKNKPTKPTKQTKKKHATMTTTTGTGTGLGLAIPTTFLPKPHSLKLTSKDHVHLKSEQLNMLKKLFTAELSMTYDHLDVIGKGGYKIVFKGMSKQSPRKWYAIKVNDISVLEDRDQINHITSQLERHRNKQTHNVPYVKNEYSPSTITKQQVLNFLNNRKQSSSSSSSFEYSATSTASTKTRKRNASVTKLDRYLAQFENNASGLFMYEISELYDMDLLDYSYKEAWNIKDFKQIFCQILHFLKLFHQAGIVLTDLKLDNVMIKKDQSVISMIDYLASPYGCSEERGCPDADNEHVSYTYQPFTLHESDENTFRADLWRLGYMMYQMLYDLAEYHHHYSDTTTHPSYISIYHDYMEKQKHVHNMEENRAFLKSWKDKQQDFFTYALPHMMHYLVSHDEMTEREGQLLTAILIQLFNILDSSYGLTPLTVDDILQNEFFVNVCYFDCPVSIRSQSRSFVPTSCKPRDHYQITSSISSS